MPEMKKAIIVILGVCLLLCALLWRVHTAGKLADTGQFPQGELTQQQETSSRTNVTPSLPTVKAPLGVADDFTDDERDFPFPEARRQTRMRV